MHKMTQSELAQVLVSHVVVKSTLNRHRYSKYEISNDVVVIGEKTLSFLNFVGRSPSLMGIHCQELRPISQERLAELQLREDSGWRNDNPLAMKLR